MRKSADACAGGPPEVAPPPSPVGRQRTLDNRPVLRGPSCETYLTDGSTCATAGGEAAISRATSSPGAVGGRPT